MPTIYDLKPGFQQLLRPLMRSFNRVGVTPNHVTVTAILASLGYGTWMVLDPSTRLPFLLLPLFMLGRMALNAIDGMLAREHDQKTRLGAILNECGDVISDAALYVPFSLLPGVYPNLVMSMVFMSVLTEFVGVLGQVIGAGRRYDGPLGKSDRAFVFGVLGLLAGLNFPLERYLNICFLIVIGLLGLTVLNRARQALRHPL
jgi:CDP-diacylglycerol--glycerol-3-phosphate 3-phosphatidyltransferase